MAERRACQDVTSSGKPRSTLATQLRGLSGGVVPEATEATSGSREDEDRRIAVWLNSLEDNGGK
ncbi:hypothetical protein ASPBRDRAFT_47965 [Aspergillus brasiliensis CBS 101740]|uniref:Uncharacterized protein n=1 Tax=Aspergillus brasiliensis (strain CBS 101740 / IMI 381727 / IBT 21946) TaxID=767769 RepID=A0A1L9U798_ASPBC|nr:hypothetical protein ASPBRDRAFT_47965 [Aspergillus brasiliensis CBS 101740]